MVECETSFLMRAVVYGLDHARTRIASWIADYNEQRYTRHWLSDAGSYVGNLTARCDRLRNPDQLRGSHVAPHTPNRVEARDASRRWMKVQYR